MMAQRPGSSFLGCMEALALLVLLMRILSSLRCGRKLAF